MILRSAVTAAASSQAALSSSRRIACEGGYFACRRYGADATLVALNAYGHQSSTYYRRKPGRISVTGRLSSSVTIKGGFGFAIGLPKKGGLRNLGLTCVLRRVAAKAVKSPPSSPCRCRADAAPWVYFQPKPPIYNGQLSTDRQ